MIDLLKKTAIDPQDPAYSELFINLQGNILKGHGRDFSANIFLHFRLEKDDLRKKILDLSKYVTSAHDQNEQTIEFNKYQVPGSMFGNLFLTRNSYRKLGFTDKQLNEWFHDVEDSTSSALPQQSNFLNGMFAAKEDLGDIPTGLTAANLQDVDKYSLLQKNSVGLVSDKELDPLEKAYKDNLIDGMLLLADDDEDYLKRKVREFLDNNKREEKVAVMAIELGRALRNDEDEGIEHFGYVDGRSQPLFLKSDFSEAKNEKRNERINEKAVRKESGDIDIWDPLAPLELVLLKDKLVENPDAYGSYFVFRKLEQDVLRFTIAEQQLADQLGLKGQARQRAGAMIVGRYPDGTPLAVSETDGYIPAKTNNFRYDGLDADLKNYQEKRDDNLGLKCPFHSHIRKTNPRQSIQLKDGEKLLDLLNDTEESLKNRNDNEKKDLNHRIVRRGIPYGERANHPKNRFQPLDDLPTGGIGLLFACFQSSINKQFAFMQKTWANNVKFRVPGDPDADTPKPATGLDTIIGQSLDAAAGVSSMQNWRKNYGPDNTDETMTDNPDIAHLDIDLNKTHPIKYNVSNFVKFRGGEFFFAPSMTFLQGKYKLNDEQK